MYEMPCNNASMIRRSLVQNAVDLYRSFALIASEPLGPWKYCLVCTFPEHRSDLLNVARGYEQQMKNEGIRFVVNPVKASDNLHGDRNGLLACGKFPGSCRLIG